MCQVRFPSSAHVLVGKSSKRSYEVSTGAAPVARGRDRKAQTAPARGCTRRQLAPADAEQRLCSRSLGRASQTGRVEETEGKYGNKHLRCGEKTPQDDKNVNPVAVKEQLGKPAAADAEVLATCLPPLPPPSPCFLPAPPQDIEVLSGS